MHRAPGPEDLLKAMKKFSEDFPKSRVPSLLGMSLQMHRGEPAVIVIGLTDVPPAGFPHGIRMRRSDTSLYVLPVVWQKFSGITGKKPVEAPTSIDLDRDMWAGAPEVIPRRVDLITPNTWSGFPTEEAPHPAQGDNAQASIPMRVPQFVRPNYWSKAFHKCEDDCVSLYERWFTVLIYEVPSDYMLIIDGISYDFRECLLPFDQFEIRVRRDTETLAQWYDMVALAATDPAHSCTFGGHIQPIPFYGRFDHNQRMMIDVLVHGPFPFTKTPSDTLGGCVNVCAKGWLASLYDNRDSGARPIDMGEFNNAALEDR